jgi:NADP-dependent 3-hydroxy acid dehydrogenase YdfG
MVAGPRNQPLHRITSKATFTVGAKAVATELPESSSEEETRKNLREFYKMAIPANSIASAIAYAVEQPAEVEIDEMVIRATAQDF